MPSRTDSAGARSTACRNVAIVGQRQPPVDLLAKAVREEFVPAMLAR